MNYENDIKKFDDDSRQSLNIKSCEKIRDPFFIIIMATLAHLHTHKNYSDWYYTPYDFEDMSTAMALPIFLTQEDIGK